MRKAFSLIELLVAVAVIGLLASILVPALAGAKAQAKRSACLSNLRQLGLATTMYLSDNRDSFWREMVTVTHAGQEGDLWWFGLEPGGPPLDVMNTPNRPLDKTRGPLVRYLRSVDDGLQCLAFPYTDGRFFSKFKGRSASYGYNSSLGPRNPLLPLHRGADHARETTSMFVFADAILYDFYPQTRFNEGYFLAPLAEKLVRKTAWGYGHFRHARQANVLFLDSHCEQQPLRGQAYPGAEAGGPAGLLTDSAGGSTIFGRKLP